MPIGEFPGMFESSNLSGDNDSREIGRGNNQRLVGVAII